MQPGALRRNASTTQFDVFLAHNTQDKPEVRVIALALKQRNIAYWIDEEQIPPGRSFQDEIQAAIPLVKSAAIFIGSQGLGCWQSWELKAFIAECVEKKIPVIPVLLPGVSSLPEDLVFLKQLRWVAFSNGVDDKAALDLLQWGITGENPQSSVQLEQKPGDIPPKIVLEEVERLGSDENRNQPIPNSNIKTLKEILIHSKLVSSYKRNNLLSNIGLDNNFAEKNIDNYTDWDFADILIDFLVDTQQLEILIKLCQQIEYKIKTGNYYIKLQIIKSNLSYGKN
ncbi:toll/interleukin-1 receptor domain-containing protein [Nostoc sp. FACHB-145]|nr:toll/interleukin-1 receptor domain-containing protein [Nostoc sp. FACHB-145]